MFSSDIIHIMDKIKKKQKNRGQVVIPENHPNPPLPHEVNIASVLAHHYQTVVKFLVPVDDYKRKTADIIMFGVEWELKCPTGASRATVGNQFRRASKQAKNVVLDTRRTKLDFEAIEKSVLFEVKTRPSMRKIQRIILIDKSEKIVEIKK